MRLIAFTAKKETGKTTAVRYMRKDLPNSVQINFKDALIDELKLYFPELLAETCKIYEKTDYDGMNIWTIDRLFKDKPPLIRSLMRNWGTEFRRAQDPDYWVKEWQKRVIEAIQHGVTHVFVDDVRFMNEANAIHASGGMLIRIESDKPVPQDAHTSESEMNFITPDKTVRNFFGSVEVLYKQLDEIK